MLHRLLIISTVFLIGVLNGGEKQPKPVFESDFSSPAAAEASDLMESSFLGRLRAGTKKISTPFGMGIQMEGRINNGALFPSSPKLNLKSEFTVSVWFRLDQLPDRKAKGSARSYTLISRGNENWRTCIDASGRVMVQNTAPDREYFIWNSGPGAIAAGKWNHIAYTYSVSRGEYALFVNGILNSVRRTSVSNQKIAPVPVDNGTALLIGSMPDYFPMKGVISGVKIFNRALNLGELEAAERGAMKKFILSLSAEAEKSGDGSYVHLLRKNAADDGLSFKTLFSLQKEYLLRLETGRTGGKLIWKIVNPTAQEIIYPDSSLGGRHSRGELRIAAAGNEFEGASFVVRPFADMERFLPVVGRLEGPRGVIEPEAVDLRVGRLLAGNGRLVNGVLLHDAAMVETDFEKMESRLRLSFPGKTVYRKLDRSNTYRLEDLHIRNFPVYDAPRLVPMRLKKGENTQFYLTFKPGKNVLPGLYRGEVRLTDGEKVHGKIQLKIRVLPFELPPPAPKYDLNREFMVSAYYFDRLKNGTDKAEGSLCIYDRNTEQVKNELRNMYDHNIRHPECNMANNFPRWHTWGKKPWGPYIFSADADDMMRQRIRLLREAGFPLKPFYLHTGGNIGFREHYRRNLHKKVLQDFVRRGNEFYYQELGHRDLFHYGIDEADGQVLLGEFEVWEDMREAGIKIFTTIKKKNVPVVAGKIHTAVAVHTPDRESARMMHRHNGRLLMYATPYYATLENPFMHRSGAGFSLWMAEYDGIYQYSYNHYSPELGLPWDRPESLHFVMPTADGVVDGVGWEGFREGIDDVRYATLFMQLLQRARSSSDPRMKKAADEAENFLNNFNPSETGFDPAVARLRMIGHILKLGSYKMER